MGVYLKNMTCDDVEKALAISPYLVCATLFLALMDLIVIVGNSLVIVAVLTNHKLRSVTNSFIASLAVSDLLLGVLVLPFSTGEQVLGYWIFESVWCSVWLAVDVWLCTASILNLVAISLDRFIAITRPMRYPRIITSKIGKLLIVIVWLLSFLICFPPLIGWNDSEVVNDWPLLELNITDVWLVNDTCTTIVQECRLTSQPGYVIYSAMGSFYIPLSVMLFFYWRIFRTALKTTRSMKSGVIVTKCNRPGGTLTRQVSTDRSVMLRVHRGKFRAIDNDAGIDVGIHQSRETSNTSRRSWSKRYTMEAKAAKTLAIVVGCFVCCWLPFFSIYISAVTCENCVSPELFSLFFWLGYCNSAINPGIYALFSREFRNAFKKILRCNTTRHSDKQGTISAFIRQTHFSRFVSKDSTFDTDA